MKRRSGPGPLDPEYGPDPLWRDMDPYRPFMAPPVADRFVGRPRFTPLGRVVLGPPWALYVVLRACWVSIGTRARRSGVRPSDLLTMAVTAACIGLFIGLGFVLTVAYWF